MPAAHRDTAEDLTAVAALEEPLRRRIYEFVAHAPASVGRDETGEALQIPRATAAFHLDRLVKAGLLDVSYQRLTGRAGPGAGRPAKLYRRSHRQVTVSLPERRYDLAGRLLAAALEEAEQGKDSPRAAAQRLANEQGRRLGEAVAAGDGGRDAVIRVLEQHGYEPSTEDDQILLRNCPFHILAKEHTELICGMNLRFLDGLVGALAPEELTARLCPSSRHCCVRLDDNDRREST